MTLQGLPKCDDVLFVTKELICQLHSAHLVCFNVLNPVFFVFLVQHLERSLKVRLDVIKEGLLICAPQVETDRVRVAERSSGSDN